MRLVGTFTVLALALATELAYRPLVHLGSASLDPPLLVILWFAFRDRRPRVHLLALACGGLRAGFGIEPLLQAWVPLAIGAELMMFTREWFDLRPARFRFPVLVIIVGLSALLTRVFVLDFSLEHARTALEAGVLGSLSTLIFFPILEALRPFLRSHKYPL